MKSEATSHIATVEEKLPVDIISIKDENPLLDYFQYLRDASKNLSIPSDWYKCLISKKNENNLPTTVEVDLNVIEKLTVDKSIKLYNYIQSYQQLLKKDSSKKIFLGIGMIFGRLDQKKLFGSIVNIPVDFEYMEKADIYRLNYHFNKSLVNYDLITALLPDYFSQEYSLISDEILSCLGAFEQELQNCRTVLCVNQQINIFLERFILLIKDILITEYQWPYKYEVFVNLKDKNSPLNHKNIYFKENVGHFFINPIPDRISTWESLNSFCQKIKNDTFDNQVLNLLLHNVFNLDYSSKQVYEKIHTEKLNLPLVLSNKQQIAIKNAFESQVSYVQGPPGTGKSYTISALVLASMLMGKKILVVAQKETALKVVQNKIKNFFDEDTIVPYIYFNHNEKKNLKANLKKLLSKADDLDCTESMKLEFSIKSKEKVLMGLEEKYNNYNEVLSVLLNKYADFYQDNNLLIKEKESFADNPVYKTFDKESIFPTKKENKNFVKDIQNIQNTYNKKSKLSVYGLNLLKHHEKVFNNFYKTNFNFKELIKNKICYDFICEWFSVSHHAFTNDEKLLSLGTEDQLFNLRYHCNILKTNIQKIKTEIFKHNHKKQLFDALMVPENKMELSVFEKMLHFQKDDKILNKMESINFDNLTKIFPVWLCEIQRLNEVLPIQNEMFDLVVVDESSQVDLAQILPVFYRAKQICVVGDHQQLGLESVGLNFSLNKKFDKMMWEKYSPNHISHEDAGEKNLILSKASILDLLRSEENATHFRYVMLDEHFRSLPGLASFNNKNFYNNELKIMTETPEKSLVPCFSGVCVSNGVKEDKINAKEAEEVINIIKYITEFGTLTDVVKARLASEIQLNSFVPRIPTIGIMSLLREQANYIDDLIDGFPLEFREKYHIVSGTPEEFQGDEFDIIILSGVVDENTRNIGHYSNPNRFNVATSRSKFYTIFVYSHVSQIPMYDKYLKHFGIFDENQATLDNNVLNWSYDEDKFESDFERVVASYINLYRIQLSKTCKLKKYIEIYNQVETCGMKRLDFVLFNPNNNKSIAVEVDGIFHFENDGKLYSESHLERMDILTRAGWKILNTPYFLWYKRGKLCPENPRFKKEMERIQDEIKIILIG